MLGRFAWRQNIDFIKVSLVPFLYTKGNSTRKEDSNQASNLVS